jgi:hypothetical protein
MQYPQRVLAVIARHPGEFVEDLAAFPPARRSITLSHRLFQFPACRHAQSPRHRRHHPAAAPLPGSSLREATVIASVTKVVSQCEQPRQIALKNDKYLGTNAPIKLGAHNP